jgi:hypothetical protein
MVSLYAAYGIFICIVKHIKAIGFLLPIVFFLFYIRVYLGGDKNI